jgi:hypothetical protein
MMFALVLVVATWGTTRVVARRLPTSRQVIASLAILTGAALMVFAPGTAARSSLFPAAHQLVPSLVSATTRGLVHALEWTLQPALWGISLLFVRAAPALARRLGVAAGGVLPILWLLGLVCACHFPAYWAMGIKPPGRALANIWIVFLAGWFVLVLPLVARALRRRGCDLRSPRLATLGRALVVIGLFVPSNVPRAIADLGLGGALRHRSEQIERAATVAEAKRTGNKDVVLVPLLAKPRTIWVDDLTADPADWRNRSYAAWHGLASVRVAAPAGR